MDIKKMEQKLSVRKYIDYLESIADDFSVPCNDDEWLETKSFITKLNDYYYEVTWAREHLMAECHRLKKIMNELEVKVNYYENNIRPK